MVLDVNDDDEVVEENDDDAEKEPEVEVEIDCDFFGEREEVSASWYVFGKGKPDAVGVAAADPGETVGIGVRRLSSVP